MVFYGTHTFIYNYLRMFTVYEYVQVYTEIGNHIYIYPGPDINIWLAFKIPGLKDHIKWVQLELKS